MFSFLSSFVLFFFVVVHVTIGLWKVWTCMDCDSAVLEFCVYNVSIVAFVSCGPNDVYLSMKKQFDIVFSEKGPETLLFLCEVFCPALNIAWRMLLISSRRLLMICGEVGWQIHQNKSMGNK